MTDDAVYETHVYTEKYSPCQTSMLLNSVTAKVQGPRLALLARTSFFLLNNNVYYGINDTEVLGSY